MDGHELTNQAMKFTAARSNLLLVVILTVVNIFLRAFGVDFHLLFSATIPQIIAVIGISISDAGGAGVIAVIAVIIAFAATSVYLICWGLSKKWRVFILVALIIFSIETIVFLVFAVPAMLFGVFDVWMLVELAVHGWILYYLVTGTIAWAKLSKATSVQIEAAHKQVQREAATAALEELSDDDKGE